jgi:hypothetical protein
MVGLISGLYTSGLSNGLRLEIVSQAASGIMARTKSPARKSLVEKRSARINP